MGSIIKEEPIPRTKKQYMPKNMGDYKSINKIFSVLAFVVATETESREEKHQNDKRKNLKREQNFKRKKNMKKKGEKNVSREENIIHPRPLPGIVRPPLASLR